MIARPGKQGSDVIKAVFRSIGEERGNGIILYQKIKVLLVVLLDDQAAFDQQSVSRSCEACHDEAIVLHVAIPVQASFWLDRDQRGFDSKLVSLSWMLTKLMGAKWNRARIAVDSAMNNMIAVYQRK